MATPTSFFSTLSQATAGAISIVLIFVVSLYTSRKLMLQRTNMAFDTEARNLYKKYFDEFGEFSRQLILMETSSTTPLLLFNAGTKTESLTTEKIDNWSKEQPDESLAKLYGYITCAMFSYEAFGHSPYMGYKKQVFENLGDHLLDAMGQLSQKSIRQKIIRESDLTGQEYNEFQELVDQAVEDWIMMNTKNFIIGITSREKLASIIDTCKYLFVVGVLVPLLFLFYVPSTLSELTQSALVLKLGLNTQSVILLGEFSLFTAQIIIMIAVLVFSWMLLNQLYDFFSEFRRPKALSTEEKDELEGMESIPKIPEEMFED